MVSDPSPRVNRNTFIEVGHTSTVPRALSAGKNVTKTEHEYHATMAPR
jgi:hypothetical protein